MIVQFATGEIEIAIKNEDVEKNAVAFALDHLGGKKVGNTRAEVLTPEQRQEMAIKLQLQGRAKKE